MNKEDLIKDIMGKEMDNLEDILNANIRAILEEHIKEVTTDDLITAREVFFKGWGSLTNGEREGGKNSKSLPLDIDFYSPSPS